MRGFGYLGPCIYPHSEGEAAARIRARSVQVSATFVTVVASSWLCTLGLLWALIGLLLAKHILVAILLMHVGLDRETAHPEIDNLLPGDPGQPRSRVENPG